MPSPSISSRQNWSTYSQPDSLKPCSCLYGNLEEVHGVQVSKPPVRRVVVARSCKQAGCNWEVIGNVSSDSLAFVDADATHPPEQLRYRIATWSTYGRCVDVPRNDLTCVPQPVFKSRHVKGVNPAEHLRHKNCVHICVVNVLALCTVELQCHLF